MTQDQIIDWLLHGDVSIQFQTYRDLMGLHRSNLQQRIATEGWGKQLLDKRKPNGHWGDRFYQPKWISTHYTVLDLRHLCLPPDNQRVHETLDMVLASNKAIGGGIQLGFSTKEHSDVCVNGMFLNYASYFLMEEKLIVSVVDSILAEKMPDGGYNCRTTRSGAKHSSLHTTISVLEGLFEFVKSGYSYRKSEITDAIQCAEEFILMHHLFKSDKTGEIIHKDFLKLAYPGRWKYDILRALDYFQYAKKPWDCRMQSAIDIILQKQNKGHTWNLQAAHPGEVHFVMENAGQPGRWNTLRAMRVLKYFEKSK
jgi:hypothetical protein